MTVTLVHDYLTQRGGAERVVLTMLRAFPDAPLHVSLYEPAATYPEFHRYDVRPMALNRLGPLRRRHRIALPLLAPAFSRLAPDGDVVVCSSSGWAHGARASGRKVVYCHAPARWLYQRERYVRESGTAVRTALALLRPSLVRWDRRAAATANRYLANSTAVQAMIRAVYGVDAEVLAPPPALDPAGAREEVEGLEPGFFLCLSRLLPYKNVDVVLRAFDRLPGRRLAVVGLGPDEPRLRGIAGRGVLFLGSVSDAGLRWLYAHCAGLVAASYEDFGLTPLEAAAFGRPAAVLRFGGFLDTVVEETTGVFFDRPEPALVRAAIERLERTRWSDAALVRQAERFSAQRFVARLREIVAEERRSVR